MQLRLLKWEILLHSAFKLIWNTKFSLWRLHTLHMKSEGYLYDKSLLTELQNGLLLHYIVIKHMLYVM